MGTRKTGKNLNCQQCGNEFYASGWQLRDTPTRQPKYCSLKCKRLASRGRRPPWAKPDDTIAHSAGYRLAWLPGHPRASRGRVLEHILVAERMLGRYLSGDESVHHKDHDKANNDPSNLLVLTSSEHSKLHSLTSPQMQSRRVEIECKECGKGFKTVPSRAHSDDPKLNRKYCSLDCRYKAWGRQMRAIRTTRRQV